ncbi:MAG: septal ring lytic transglycosylase RlpA family protein [Nitrospiraceae bacterium]|nr:septal ring lytic transglycosylase RlpA family protein [Nitrospiraceae bacterium]
MKDSLKSWKMRTSAVTYFRAAKAFPLLLIAVALLIINGCATVTSKKPPGGGGVCMASWYGPEFIGQPTASGRTYRKNDRTAANPTLPFGTILKVTNLSSGASTIVTVNDRGPFKRGRCLDLSYQAALDIGLVGQGSGWVSFQIIGRDPSYVKSILNGAWSGPGPYTIQVASFDVLSNALRLRSILELNYDDVYLSKVSGRGGRPLYRINIGKFRDEKAAGLVAAKLAAEGYGVMITQYNSYF